MQTKAPPKKTRRRSRIQDLWRLLFAIVGFLDCSCFCYSYYYHNEYFGDNNNNNPKKKRPFPFTGNNKNNNNTKSKGGKTFFGSDDEGNHQKTYHAFLLLHLGFGVLCGIEMILRAREARRIIYENQAIAAFEEHIASTVAKVYHRRNLLRGKGRFSHFTLRRPSDAGTTSLSPITTGTSKRNPYFPKFNFSSPKMNHTIQEENSSDDDNTSEDHDRNSNDDEDSMDMDDEATDKRNILLFLRSTFNIWLPIGVTCAFWLSLLPFQAYYRIIRIFLNDYWKPTFGNVCTVDGDEAELFDGDQYCEIDSDYLCASDVAETCYVETLGDDTSFATLWITSFLVRWTEMVEEVQEYLMNKVWKRYLLGSRFTSQSHKELHRILHNVFLDRPKLIWFRVGRILNVIKWMRFAFPLARMTMKLQDQVRTGYSTFQKVKSVRSQREKRLQRPSLLLRDLRRIESIHKVETTLAAWPSQCSMLLDTLAKEVSQAAPARMKLSSTMATMYAEDFLRKSRERGRQITMQIQRLHQQLRRNLTEFSYSEIHDNILKLSQGVSRRHLFSFQDDSDDEDDKETPTNNDNSVRSNSNRSHRSTKGRWYDFLHLETLLSSREYLISPRSRFSVVWRITVTNCLLLELTRLSVSWYLTQTFHLPITQVIGRLFVNCGTRKEDTKRKFKFVTDRLEEWHVGLSRAIPLVPFPKDSLWILCVPTSTFSKLLLLLGSALETFIDVVSFLDIFFWFFTGDLDASTGIVVPKAFFGRCILPGTLVQILDHPTLPHFLPSVLAKIGSIASQLGWSRLVLWACALVPALVAEVILPFASYFFQHYEETDQPDAMGGTRGSTDQNKKGDILMTYAESFGYLPTRSSTLLERRAATPLWIRETGSDDFWSQSRSSSDDDYDPNDDDNNNDDDDDDDDGDEDDIGHLHAGVLERSSMRLSSILTPPRSTDSNSSVRFARDVDVSMAPSMPSRDESFDTRSERSSSWGQFDIGLSLSSHDLDELHNDHQ